MIIDLYHLYRSFHFSKMAYPIVLDVLKVWAESNGWRARVAICKESGVDLATDAGVVDKSGTWLSLGATKLGQGRDKAVAFLRENKDVLQTLERETKKALGFPGTGGGPLKEVVRSGSGGGGIVGSDEGAAAKKPFPPSGSRLAGK